MKISTQTIKYLNEYFGSAGDPAPNGTDDLVRKIGAQLAGIEEVADFGKKFEQVVVVKLVSYQDHPGADRLHICKVDDGHKMEGVERDQDGLVQIVCAAPNLRNGMLAAWLPPGSTVPSTVDKDPFVLEARDFRGHKSNGMMASPRELGLGDAHDGILEIDEELGPITPGTMFIDAFHLRGDVVIDMENKMFTHRPDCFGWLGLARELEGIHGRRYKSPDWYKTSAHFPDVEAEELPLQVINELPELVPRFTAIAMRGVKVGPSPVWLQVDLARVGLRPINNLVDYSNFYMLLTGQPIHIYDYDKVAELSGGDKATITVRYPREGEKITLLNGKTVTPRKEAMMVAAGDYLICVGGAMGGSDTEVSDDTENIIIEAANWDMFSMRRTSMEHGIFTDAVSRFNKGQSPLQNLAVTWKIMDQIRSYAGGKVASELVDLNNVSEDAVARGNIHAPVVVDADFINVRLGWNLSAQEIQYLLENVEFKVEVSGQELTITAPFWRTDIEIREDIVEEVGRLNGYDKLPIDLPKRDLTPSSKNARLSLQQTVRGKLSSAGANEVLGYSFVHGNLLDNTSQDKERAFKISNALSPDLQYYRLSLTPGLLEKVHQNIKSGYDQFVLFEMGRVHCKGINDQEDLPQEDDHLALVFAANDKTAQSLLAGAPYYQAKHYLSLLLPYVVVTHLADFDFGSDVWGAQMCAPYEPKRSAVIVKDGLAWGVVGEFKSSVRRSLKLPEFSAGFEIALDLLGNIEPVYTKLPRFPKVEQDICLKVSTEYSYQRVYDVVSQHLHQNRPDATHHTVEPLDIYQRPDDKGNKQITFRISLASFERTLTDQEVNTLLDTIAQTAKQEIGAERI